MFKVFLILLVLVTLIEFSSSLVLRSKNEPITKVVAPPEPTHTDLMDELVRGLSRLKISEVKEDEDQEELISSYEPSENGAEYGDSCFPFENFDDDHNSVEDLDNFMEYEVPNFLLNNGTFRRFECEIELDAGIGDALQVSEIDCPRDEVESEMKLDALERTESENSTIDAYSIPEIPLGEVPVSRDNNTEPLKPAKSEPEEVEQEDSDSEASNDSTEASKTGNASSSTKNNRLSIGLVYLGAAFAFCILLAAFAALVLVLRRRARESVFSNLKPIVFL